MFSNSGHVMTLANSIIGVGILAMPFCFQKCGIILSIVLLIISNWVTRICCHYLIKSSLLTRRKSFEFLGFHAFGSSGKTLVELCIIGYLLGTCITYFVVVGDLGPQIVTKILALENGHIHLRTLVMIAVTLVCILPLGMLKNVDSLAAVCTASIGFYVCLVFKIFLESQEHILANDWTDNVVYWEPAGVLQCLPIFSMALSCQMQIFEVFSSINNQSMEKLNGIVKNATWICTFVYIAVGFFGYVAFCKQPFSGNILMNFSPSFGSDVIKSGFVLSVAFSFPLVIFPCRASIYSLLYRRGHTDASGYIPESRFKYITVFIVLFALCIALMIPSVELIIGLVGSTIGVAICIMFPATCFRQIVKKNSTERSLAQFILVSGFCLMILGTYANLNAIDVKRSGAHLQMPHMEQNSLKSTEFSILITQDNSQLRDKELKAKGKNNVIVKSEQKAVKLENLNKIAKEVKLDIRKDSRLLPQIAKSSLPPVLPVDEKHDEPPIPDLKSEVKLEKEIQPADSLKAISPMPDVVSIELNKSESKDAPQILKAPASVNKLAPPAVEITLRKESNKNSMPQQSINKDAIKKDDDIAAEDKNDKTKDDELKKTQNELKKAKELLERTVDELKEKLEKQNKETQNLVVEKLGEVVEKVEEIERKVNQNEQQSPAPSKEIPKAAEVVKDEIAQNLSVKQNEQQAVPPVEAANNAQQQRVDLKEQQPSQQAAAVEDSANAVNRKKLTEPSRINKGSLLSQLAERANINDEVKTPAPHQMPESLSNKIEELIDQAKNGSKIEQRLPLPLALLINASHAKANDGFADQTQGKRDTLEILNAPSNQNEIKHDKLAQVENKNKNINSISKDSNKAQENDRVNVEAIRRDILQLSKFKLQDATTTMPSVSVAEAQQRVKREITDFKAINVKLEKENYPMAPKIDALIADSLSSAVEIKMQNIGRDLKSLKDNVEN